MHKTNENTTEIKILVDINNLQRMLDLGRNTAAIIGEKAGAVVTVGRRKLYKVKKIEEYIEGKSSIDVDGDDE